MNYILVLQWQVRSGQDYDDLTAMEELLSAELTEAHGAVDGHDFGSGEMNIFIHTKRPLEAFADIATSLSSHSLWSDARAAYRPMDEDDFVILWPPTLEHFQVS